MAKTSEYQDDVAYLLADFFSPLGWGFLRLKSGEWREFGGKWSTVELLG